MPKHYKPPTPDSSEDTSLTGSTSGASVSPPEDAGQPGAPGSSSESGGGGNAASSSGKAAPPKKRNGKVVGALRKKYTPTVCLPPVNLAPSSTSAQMASAELAASLSYHLVKVSSGVMTTPNSPPFLDLTPTWMSLRLGRRSATKADPIGDVLMASLIALGSRRSYHSSIIGGAGTVRFPATSSIGDIVERQYGEKREGSCRALIQRAVGLAEDTKILEDHSPLANEVVTVLRVILFAVTPRHPFTSKLVQYLHDGAKRRHAVEGVTAVDVMGLSIAECDGYTAILLGQPPKISDSELNIYGWHPGLIPAALDRLRVAAGRARPDHTLQSPSRIITIGLLRGVIKIQRQDVSDSQDFVALGQLFSRLWEWLDVHELSVAALHGNEGSESDRRTITPHLGATPMVIEANLTAQACRLCSGSEVQLAQDILELAKLRFLRWLKNFIEFMDDRQFYTGPDANHTRALLLSILDIFPLWVELTVEAAAQDAAGGGPLACAGFTWTILATLHDELKFVAAVFARSSRQEARLAKAFSELGIDGEQLTRSTLARSMVGAALGDISPSPTIVKFRRTLCLPTTD